MPEPTPTQPRRSRPFRSLIISLVMGVLLFAVASLLFEGLYRWTRLDGILYPRSVGLFHNQFEIKWFELKDFVRERGGVDVILLGSSMVNTGIDPDVFSEQYASAAGQELRVFNFGVEGFTISPNAEVARLLVQEYHPSTLVFVTEMRDYVAANGLEVEQQVLSDEWFTARLTGTWSLRAWLKENSKLVQHLLPYRNWSRADFPDTFLMSLRRFGDTTSAGYEPDQKTASQLDVPPDPDSPDDQALFAMFSNYAIDPGRLTDLADMISLQQEGTQVIITELPLHPSYFTYFGGEDVHRQYLAQLVPFIESVDGVFLPPPSPDRIPPDHRSDRFHLNYKGAPLYSRLLADQLSALCQTENVCLLVNSPVEAVP